MKKIRNTVFMLIILTLANTGIIHAQTDIRIQSDFKKIEIYMLKIWDLVRQFNDTRAMEYLTQAKIELDKARELLFRDNP